MTFLNVKQVVGLLCIVFTFQFSINTYADEDICDGPYKKKFITNSQLEEITKLHREWLVIYKRDPWSNEIAVKDERRANFCGAYLDDVEIVGDRFDGAIFTNAKITNSKFKSVSLANSLMNNIDIKDSSFDDVKMNGIESHGGIFLNVEMNKVELKNSVIENAKFIDVRFSESDISSTKFTGSLVQNTNFVGAKVGGAMVFDDAIIRGSVFKGANFKDSSFKRAKFIYTSLVNSMFINSNLDDISFIESDLDGVLFEPETKYLPSVNGFIYAKNVHLLRYFSNPQALSLMANKAKSAGVRDLERDFISAKKRSDMKTYERSGLPGHIESTFSYIVFELTTEWGRKPGRALWIIFINIFVFAVFYGFFLYKRQGSELASDSNAFENGIWKVWSKEALTPKSVAAPELLGLNLLDSIKMSLYFSLLSAFHVGWKNISIGGWIARLQKYEFTLKSTGWARVISGFQSLISVYLLAIWILTYFGRPFE